MVVKKAFGKIFGATFTKAEEKALDIEIRKALAEMDEKNTNEIDAMILWYLHERYGFGVKRLREFHDFFVPAIKSLCKQYEMNTPEEKCWIFTHKLKEIGADIEQWNRELEE